MTFLWLALACLLSLGMFATLDAVSFALRRTGWQRFLSAFLLFYAQIIGTEFLLGLTSTLYNYSLALLNLVITVAVVVALREKYGDRILRDYLKNIKSLLRRVKEAARQDIFLTVLAVISTAFLAWIIFIGIIFPPIDWDGSSYHLTYAADLVQNHDLYDVPALWSWLVGYPKGGEFIQAWTILLSHNDTLADLTQVPFLILAVVALYAVARNLGVTKRNARYAALLFAFTPSVLNQLTSGYIDVMLGATFFAALALALQKTYHKLDLALIGVALSLLIAIKSSGIYLTVIVLLLLLWNLYGQCGRQLKRYALSAALVLAPMVFGLYWYVKNLILYHSPIYPFGFQIAGKTLFKGLNYADWQTAIAAPLPDNPLLRLWYTWSEGLQNPLFVYNYDSSYFGFGPIWFVILVPALLLSICLAVKKRHYPFLALLILLFGVLMIYPTNFSPRYTLFIFSAGVVGLGLVLDNLQPLTTRFVKAALVVLAVVTVVANFMLYSYGPHNVRRQVSSIFSQHTQRGNDTIFETNFGNAYLTMHHTAKSGQTVVYTSGYWVYPLWNDDFSNRVTYIEAATKDDWYKQVKEQGADYIFISTDTKVKQNRWAMDKFKNVIYDNGWYEILKVD